jgi:hypothetical protein
MNKTTIYLPDDLRAAVKHEALRRNIAEAEVIRDAIRTAIPVERPKPKFGLFSGDGSSIAETIDERMKGFGQR